jgi:hypothetical protein
MKGKRSVDAERLRITNERIIRCLEKLRIKDIYAVKHFELAYMHGFKDKNGKTPNALMRKRNIRRMLTGNVRLDMMEYVERLEEFTEVVLGLGKKKKNSDK